MTKRHAPRHDDPADEAADWLLRLRDRPDDAGLRADWSAWLARDPGHARAWEAAQRMWRIAGMVGPAAPDTLARASAKRIRPRHWGTAVAAMAACLMLFLLPGLGLHWRADYLTAPGETRRVDLADGSRIHLDSATGLAVAFTDAQRRVTLLSGQAYFEVAPDKSHPFLVRAGDSTVMVTGTAFAVRRDGDAVTVDVQSGSVRVDYPRHAGMQSVHLAPGDRLEIGDDEAMGKISSLAPGQIAPWRRGRLLVESASVERMAEEIQRYRPGLIVVTDRDLAQKHVTGVFDLHDPLRALRTVVEPHDGHVREITPWLAVVSRR